MFKSSAIQKTTPIPISLIPQKGFTWEIDEAKNVLKIIDIDPQYLIDLDPNQFSFCVYGWDKEPKEFLFYEDLHLYSSICLSFLLKGSVEKVKILSTCL